MFVTKDLRLNFKNIYKCFFFLLFMKKVMLIFVVGILLMSFAFAQGIHESGTGLDNPEIKEAGQALASGVKRVVDGDYVGEAGEKIKIQNQANNKVRLEVGGIGVDCDCNMTQEQVQNMTKLKTMLSNGRNVEIKVMPNTASETALQRLRLKNCVEGECSIELKEVGRDEQTKLAYEVNTERPSKVFGLFGAGMQVQAQVDAETGEIIGVKKPWWAFLASEPEED